MMMWDEKIKELFGLCMEVTFKTSAFVSFQMMSHVKCCNIYIRNEGFDEKADMGERYSLYFDNSSALKNFSMDNYEAATEHLERLLKENGS